MFAVARVVRRWSLLPLGTVVLLLALAGVPAAPQLGANGSAATKGFDLHSALAYCPTLAGTNTWSGSWGTGAATSGGGVWDLALTATGNTLSGYVNAGPFDNTFVSGTLNCNTFTLSTSPGAFPELSSPATISTTVGTAGELSGTWSAELSLAGPVFTGAWQATNVTVPNVSIVASGPPPATLGPVTYTATLTGTGPLATNSMTISDSNASGPVGSPCVETSTDNVFLCTFNEDSADSPYTITASYPGDSFYDTFTTTLTVGSAVSNGIGATSSTNQVTATAAGGIPNTDNVSTTSYDVPPVAPLSDGTNYFDVAASSGFSQVTVTDCSNVTASTDLQWFNPLDNGGFGAWETVVSDNPPVPVLGSAVYSSGCLTAYLDANSTPSVTELGGTVFATAPLSGPAIDSENSAVGRVGSRLSVTVRTIGSPTPSISARGRLPRGLHLVNNHNGTATITGTPGPKSGGVYSPIIKAVYGHGSTKVTVDQTLTLVVYQAPVFKTSHLPSAHVGSAYRVTVRTGGYTAPVLSWSGTLPSGVTFTDNGNGTATLAGTPAPGSARSYDIAITASNGVGNPARKTFSFVVHV